MADLFQTKDWLKHLPNKLTLARIAAIPLLLVLYPLSPRLGIFCAFVFGFAAFTDLLDGWLARRYGNVTALGALLDPIADKMLISAALVLLAAAGHVPAVLAGLMICRDIAVNGIRLLANEKRFAIPVADSGKWKTALQSVAIFCLFVYVPWLGLPFAEVGIVTLWIAAGLSLYSAFHYGQSYWRLAKDLT